MDRNLDTPTVRAALLALHIACSPVVFPNVYFGPPPSVKVLMLLIWLVTFVYPIGYEIFSSSDSHD